MKKTSKVANALLELLALTRVILVTQVMQATQVMQLTLTSSDLVWSNFSAYSVPKTRKKFNPFRSALTNSNEQVNHNNPSPSTEPPVTLYIRSRLSTKAYLPLPCIPTGGFCDDVMYLIFQAVAVSPLFNPLNPGALVMPRPSPKQQVSCSQSTSTYVYSRGFLYSINTNVSIIQRLYYSTVYSTACIHYSY